LVIGEGMQSKAESMKPCPSADPAPRPPGFAMPAGACDTHAHVFGPAGKLSLESIARLHAARCLAGSLVHLHTVLDVDRGVLTQPSVYGTDNRAMLDYVGKHLQRMRAVVSVDGNVTDTELRAVHDQGAPGIRVNLADKGGNPFTRFSELTTLWEKLRPMGWHIEFLIHVHQMDEYIADIDKLRVETSIGHFGYMPAALGVSHPKFRAFLDRRFAQCRCPMMATCSINSRFGYRTPAFAGKSSPITRQPCTDISARQASFACYSRQATHSHER
jgi:predicted TIM-barrel fold metal-dependent hydrolase